MQKMRHYKNKRCRNGFTLVEIIIVVVILSIAALIAVPMVSSAADIQVRSAANQIAAHLDYAKSMAITHQRRHWVEFNESDGSYKVWTVDDVGTEYVIDHPVNPGDENFIVNLSNSGLDKVDITDANFDEDPDKAITFDYLGSPYHGKGTDPVNALNRGVITLEDKTASFTLYVIIQPVTGYVTIDDTPPAP